MGKEAIRISVIVTIHNAEKYINECLDSVLCQTFRDMEILCIDGGSTDRTPEILRTYAEKDRRIRIINDPDTGYGHKVNRGIQEAKGIYISVLESDDMYEPCMLEVLYETAEKHHVDFVNGNYTNFYDGGGLRFGYITRMYQEKDYNCLIDYRKEPERFGVTTRYWTGLFRKEFLERERIKMNESPGASYQDMSFRFLTSILAERAYHLDIPLYLYRIDNPGSSMYDLKKTVEIADEHEFLKRELMKRDITDRFIWHNAYQWKYMDFRGNMRHLKGRYRQELFDRYLQELEKDRALLEEYSDLGYSSFVGEMIYETPERVKALLEQDEVVEREEREKEQRFSDDILNAGIERGIVVFGCGRIGKTVLERLRFVRGHLCCLSDNSEALWNTQIEGINILPPEETVRRYPDALYIVANKLHAQDIRRQLQDMGISEDMISIY